MTRHSHLGAKSSRRKVGIHDASRWVFNRMAHVYDARPPYPAELVDAVARLATLAGSRIVDVGAGIGHLALPLAQRGFDVIAVEPAERMLERLRKAAADGGLPVRAVHAAAEQLPLEPQSLDLVVIADALHFIDTELAGQEVARVLGPRGALVVITCELAPTPFMQQVMQIMVEAAQRRPRPVASRSAQLSGVAKIQLTDELCFQDETPVTRSELEQILASISFIGPAMNAQRTGDFHQRIHAIALPARWARRFTLQFGFRRRPTMSASNCPHGSGQ